ncbi:Sterile alpha motif (SAM) domain-containing protein [Abeliophyllum distichum]|uniref:Sterile alpha motif (SAM) domain-containing protein n=1 Tax=Abeliophyllum distichum TaxID=126358 RepID=A0ABD1W1I8_9LAMI
MATELQPPEGSISIGPPTTTAQSPDPPPIDHSNPKAGPSATNNPGPSLAPKRQRRPSVRLGEIGGDPPYDHHNRRPNKTWRFHKDPTLAAKTSRTRPLTNLVNGGGSNYQDTLEPAENYTLSTEFTLRKPKNKKATKRVRTNWNKFESAVNIGGGGAGGGGIVDSANNFDEEQKNNNPEFQDFEPEGSESPLLKEQSPVNSVENMGLQYWDQQRRGSRVRVSESNGIIHDEINSQEQRSGRNVAVREWLIGLGLGRYAPVFEIHEVDDEVLPMLTLEDLKDMGINAVGSRRKMYSAILKLRKGFS